GSAHRSDHFALFDRVADFDVDAAEMQEHRTHPVTVIDDEGAPGEVQVNVGEDDPARNGRSNRGAAGCGDIHAAVWRSWPAVVAPLAAETPADAALHRPHEGLGEPGARRFGLAGLRHASLLARDARG